MAEDLERTATPGEEPAEENDYLQVVVNDEEQYSVWSAHTAPPEGWRTVGYTGTRERCLAYIEEVWTDMRPLSVRRQLAGDT
jgi:MbtH protein